MNLAKMKAHRMTSHELSDQLYQYIPIVEKALSQSFDIPLDSNLPLYRMMHFQLGWIDENGEAQNSNNSRIYGCLCLESVSLLDSDYEKKSAVAASIELLKESVQTHEDMQTANQSRHGRSAVWWLWGPAQSINVGDGLHALSRLSLFSMQNVLSSASVLQAVGALDSSALSYYGGQYLELELQERIDVSVKEYLAMAKGKYGSILGSTLSLGAIVSGADQTHVSVMQELGETLGMASAISEEINAIFGTSTHPGRALNKSKLYPIVAGLEQASLSEKRELGGYYFKRVMDLQDLTAIKKILENLGAKEQSEQFIKGKLEHAYQLIESLRLPPNLQNRWNELSEKMVWQSE